MEELSRLLDAGWRLHAGGRVEGTSLEHSVQVTLVHGAKKANGVAATFEIALYEAVNVVRAEGWLAQGCR